MSSQKKRIAVLGLTAVALLAVMAACWFAFGQPQSSAGQKELTVVVDAADGSPEEFSFSTAQEFLRGALEEQELIAGEDSQYGLFVTEVNGVIADDSQQQWWCFTKDGATLNTGVDSTPVADGDHFEITLKLSLIHI